MAETPYYPVMMNIKDRWCLVVGGGRIATHKVKGLLEAGANVCIVSPELTPELQTLVDSCVSTSSGSIRYLNKAYRSGDLSHIMSDQTPGLRLVFAATNVSAVNADVVKDCRLLNLPVASVSEPTNNDFVLPSSLRRGGLTIAVSTSGASPGLAKQIRDELAADYGEEYSLLVATLEQFRAVAITQVPDEATRRKLLTKVLDEGLLQAIREGQLSAKQRELWQTYFGLDVDG